MNFIINILRYYVLVHLGQYLVEFNHFASGIICQWLIIWKFLEIEWHSIDQSCKFVCLFRAQVPVSKFKCPSVQVQVCKAEIHVRVSKSKYLSVQVRVSNFMCPSPTGRIKPIHNDDHDKMTYD
jgi:hypothetical protein